MLQTKFADPMLDVAFKKLFANREHKEVLMSFLNAFLERKEGYKIMGVELLDLSTLPLMRESQATIVARCTNQDGSCAVVMVQGGSGIAQENQSYFPERSLAYASYVYTQQPNGQSRYKKLMPVIFIGIVDFDLFDGVDAISHYYIGDSKTHERTLMDLEYYFVELKKFSKQEDELETITDKWIYFLKHAAEFDAVPQALNNPEEIATALTLLDTHL